MKNGKNFSKISISSRKLNMIKAFKILELLNINNMIMYIDDEYDDEFFKVLNSLNIDFGFSIPGLREITILR